MLIITERFFCALFCNLLYIKLILKYFFFFSYKLPELYAEKVIKHKEMMGPYNSLESIGKLDIPKTTLDKFIRTIASQFKLVKSKMNAKVYKFLDYYTFIFCYLHTKPINHDSFIIAKSIVGK